MEGRTVVGTVPPKKKIRVFPIVVIVIAVLFIILFIVNVYQWNRIRTSTTETSPVARSEANVQFWLNLIWIFVALGLLAYAFVALFSKKKPTVVRVAAPARAPVATMMSSGVTATAAPLADVIPIYEASASSGNVCRRY